MIDAGLGHNAEAIREGQRASELLPVSKESINGSLLMQYLAVIYAWVGERIWLSSNWPPRQAFRAALNGITCPNSGSAPGMPRFGSFHFLRGMGSVPTTRPTFLFLFFLVCDQQQRADGTGERERGADQHDAAKGRHERIVDHVRQFCARTGFDLSRQRRTR